MKNYRVYVETFDGLCTIWYEKSKAKSAAKIILNRVYEQLCGLNIKEIDVTPTVWTMNKARHNLILSIKDQVDSMVEYHLKSGDYDTADAIMNEFYEWFDDSQPCEVIGVRVQWELSSHINHQQIIIMAPKITNVMWFGLFCIVIGSLTTIWANQPKPSGGFSTPRQVSSIVL